MSTLVLVLTAAMAVPGSGPKVVSGEMEQGLDLRGKWEGVKLFHREWPTTIHSGKIAQPGVPPRMTSWEYTDEGKGKFRAKIDGVAFVGIYEGRGSELILCLRHHKGGRPTCFQPGNGQHLFILHRVSRK